MTTQTKTEQAAEFFQVVLNNFHRANSENARFRSEVERLQGKVATLERLLDQKERRMILLTELLSRRCGEPNKIEDHTRDLAGAALIEVESEVIT